MHDTVDASVNGRTFRRWWSRVTHRAHEQISDTIDLDVLDARWPEPDGASDWDGPDPAAGPEHHSGNARLALAMLRPKTLRLGVAGLVIAAMVAASAGTRYLAPRTQTYTPPWVAACQDAVKATAQLHRLQDIQFAQGMQEAWALIGGGAVPNPTPFDTTLNAQLQRNADDATGRCISPATPQ